MMKNEVVENVLNGMIDILNSEQMVRLKTQIIVALSNFDVSKKETSIIQYNEDTNLLMLKNFVNSKIASGKSKNTARTYYGCIKFALSQINKQIENINEEDLRLFLYKYQIQRGNSITSTKNMRAYLSSFFNWLRKNRYIVENPMDLVEPIKSDYTIKQPYTDEEIVKIKDSCSNKRDRAIVDFLDASLIRIGELNGLDRNDIVFTDRECIVYGKGKKERIAYFNGEAKIHLQEYLESRKDNDPALFVGLKRNGKRLSIEGIQNVLKRIGRRSGIDKVHAHRFRRTGATRCLSAGMPIEELQIIMGHSDIKTTLIYAKIDQRKVRFKYNSIYSW